MKDSEDLPIPAQREGAKSDTEHSVQFRSEEEAHQHFINSKRKLFNVNYWHEWCGMAISKFELTDSKGSSVQRLPREGDFIKIDVPGPGTKTGEGYDWVQIENIQESGEGSSEKESVVMNVRPAPSPLNPDNDTAHFFTDEATSSFIVRRENKVVYAEVHGRNEKPNTEATSILDKARNVAFGLGAISGLSKIQWKNLVKGLLTD